jgi:nitroimidazol reductase NimA-like FMN-containing flavoprotein (pyridoxamine 5'-phosphate oxidase superfamily)
MAERDLADMARAIIDANQYMTLATADAQGQPWASPVFYATADYAEFYWISAPEARHSGNLAQRPEISIVIFDSRAPEGTGQAVYLAATAEEVPDDDLDRALGVFPGPAERGPAPRYTREQLQFPAPYRLYRATVYEHSILCPRDEGGTEACTAHGAPFDHRVQVRVAGGFTA